VNTWSVAGTLVDTVTRQPIAGATITPSWELAAVQTGADGRFELGAVANPPTTPYKVTVSGTDLISRELWITWQRGARTEVTIDAIRNRPPFSLEYYRQLARGTYDNDGPYAIFRWMESPKFYLKTVDQNGRPVEPEVLAVVREALPRAVTEFTRGKLSATVETGTDSRAPATGWINVDIVRNPREERVCGFAQVGANPGSITLNNDVCSCGSNKIPAPWSCTKSDMRWDSSTCPNGMPSCIPSCRDTVLPGHCLHRKNSTVRSRTRECAGISIQTTTRRPVRFCSRLGRSSRSSADRVVEYRGRRWRRNYFRTTTSRLR
jgi:hypothetical protein